MPSITSPTFLGLDVHKNTISAGILRPGEDVPDVEKISSDEESVRRLVARLGNPRQLRACYEAGPTGYELARLLGLLGVACQVIAPTLILTAPGDRVKTDKRDCRRLARLHRAGQLVAVRVPTVAEEAVRDLCRARADMVIDPARARHRLGKFLLRHGRVWRDGAAWTMKHQAWAQRFEDKALEATFAHYRATLDAREAAVETIEADLVAWFRRPPFAEAVARLGAYRGITHNGCAPPGERGLRLAAFPVGRLVHGLHRPHFLRALERNVGPARRPPPAPPAGLATARRGAVVAENGPGKRRDRQRPSQSLPSRPRRRAEPGRGPHHAPGRRRRRTDPRLSNAQPTGALSQGQLSANCRTAAPTRAHQSGGQPTSPAPAHGRALTRPPPWRTGA